MLTACTTRTLRSTAYSLSARSLPARRSFHLSATTSRHRSANYHNLSRTFTTMPPKTQQSQDAKRPRTSDSNNSEDDWKSQPPYALKEDSQKKEAKFTGSCHCHDVTWDVYVTKPLGSHFCHCDTCQKLHGSATHWSVVIPKNEMLFTCSPEKLSFYRTEDQKTERILPCKLSCARCHSPIADEGRNMMLMYPSTWDWPNKEARHPFLPDKHIFYAQRAIDIEDGMPKWEKMADESEQMPEEHHHGEKGVAGSGSKKN